MVTENDFGGMFSVGVVARMCLCFILAINTYAKCCQSTKQNCHNAVGGNKKKNAVANKKKQNTKWPKV